MNTVLEEKIPDCFTKPVRHQTWKAALNRLVQLIRMNSAVRMVIVTGPTGVGKSALLAALKEQIDALASAEMNRDRKLIPRASCSIKAPGAAAFSWKDTYLQLLHSLQHPFPDPQLLSKAPHMAGGGTEEDSILKPLSASAAHRLSNDRLFRILQRTIEHRRPKAILLDEAHHLLRITSSQTLINQLEHLKYMADETQTLHILFGTYELIQLTDLSSALARRREVIHFPRYVFDPKNKGPSLEEFAKACGVFQNSLQHLSEVNLLQEVPFLYQGSVGCVGLLRNWLYNAFQASRLESSGLITKRHLEDAAPPAADRMKTLEDARIGEAYFAKRATAETDYLRLLGFSGEESNDPPPKPTKPRNRSKPFRRNPHHDRTGIGALQPEARNAA